MAAVMATPAANPVVQLILAMGTGGIILAVVWVVMIFLMPFFIFGIWLQARAIRRGLGIPSAAEIKRRQRREADARLMADRDTSDESWK